MCTNVPEKAREEVNTTKTVGKHILLHRVQKDQKSTAGSEWLPVQRANSNKGSGRCIAYPFPASLTFGFVIEGNHNRSH